MNSHGLLFGTKPAKRIEIKLSNQEFKQACAKQSIETDFDVDHKVFYQQRYSLIVSQEGIPEVEHITVLLGTKTVSQGVHKGKIVFVCSLGIDKQGKNQSRIKTVTTVHQGASSLEAVLGRVNSIVKEQQHRPSPESYAKKYYKPLLRQTVVKSVLEEFGF